MLVLSAALCILAQAIGLLAFGWMMFEFMTLPAELLEQIVADREFAKSFVAETLESYRLWAFYGIVAAIGAWALIARGWYRASWFLASSRVLAFLWLPLVPVGTLLGLLILRARSRTIVASN